MYFLHTFFEHKIFISKVKKLSKIWQFLWYNFRWKINKNLGILYIFLFTKSLWCQKAESIENTASFIFHARWKDWAGKCTGCSRQQRPCWAVGTSWWPDLASPAWRSLQLRTFACTSPDPGQTRAVDSCSSPPVLCTRIGHRHSVDRFARRKLNTNLNKLGISLAC